MSQIDENLYSRQLYVMGHSAMEKLSKSTVIVYGLNGLGLEIAKNIILSGIGNVIIHDTKNTQYSDLTTQYYLTENDIGKNRAEACLERLTELNMYVTVHAHTKKLTEDYIRTLSYTTECEIVTTVIVLTDSLLDEQIKINKWTRKYNVKFINCCTYGLFGQIFCDFGDFTIFDVDGEVPNTATIENITNEENAMIICTKPHNMTSGSTVELLDIKGMKRLNKFVYLEFEITYVDRFSFRIGVDTRTFDKYDGL